jgi:2,4-dichlorophenol 6-monooxygenase
MNATLACEDGRRRVASVIRDQAEHFDMLGLQLGFAYAAGALVDDGSPAPAKTSARELVPQSRPGSRLPHGWLERDGARVSTLDLVAYDRFTLLAGPGADAWTGAARQLGLRSLRIGRDVADASDWWTRIADMDVSGALLVRPDQHVAFRSRGREDDPGRVLREVHAALLRRP